jgi:hypothetical protein
MVVAAVVAIELVWLAAIVYGVVQLVSLLAV